MTTPPSSSFMVFFARILVLYCAWSVGTGLLLSAFHQLKPVWIAVCFAGFAVAAISMWTHSKPSLRIRPRRYCRLLPAVFLIVCVLGLAGGVIHPPSNYDFLTYRYPRLFYWLSEQSWLWIDHFNRRTNIAGTTSEWSLLPLFLIGHGDRLFFLLNLAMYCCLPSLTYVIGLQLGIRRKAVWILAWLVPGLAGAVMQAGSAGNDLPGLFFFLASLAFVLKGTQTRSWLDISMALIAAALLTSVKASNIPLVLPVLISLSRLVPWVIARPIRIAAVFGIVTVGIPLSFIPSAIANHLHTGSWNGDPNNEGKFQIASPWFGIAGNGLQLLANSVNPPLFPFAKLWNKEVLEAQYKRPNGWLAKVREEFPRLDLNATEIQNEEYAGLGPGILFVMLVAGAGAVCSSGALHSSGQRIASHNLRSTILAGGLLALFVFLAKFGNESGPRLLLPYYPVILLGFFSIPKVERIASQRWMRVVSGVAAFAIIPSLLITPSRPLIPMAFLLNTARIAGLPEAMLDRMSTVYLVYGNRNDVLANVRDNLPQSENEIGWIAGGNDPEVSLWRPFGSRRLVPIITTSKGDIASTHVPRYCVVSQYLLDYFGYKDPNIWAKQHDFQLVSTHEAILTVNRGKENFYLMRRASN